MSSSQRKAFITLIEKQGKDRTLIENCRPISLINVDAKITSKVIKQELKKGCQALSTTIEQVMLMIALFVRQLDRFLIKWNLQIAKTSPAF